jgi:hypothetical protein
MSETGSPGGVRPTEDAVWRNDPEVPDTDTEEQRRDLLDDREDTDPEAVAGRDHRHQLAEPPLEVSEADLVEQLVDVSLDDDLDRD